MTINWPMNCWNLQGISAITDMTPARNHIEISGIQVEIVRKDIKNLHVGVYPPNGRVRAAVPLRIDDEAVRLAIISRLGWIRRQQAQFTQQQRQTQREMISGESHYLWGKRYLLDVIERQGRHEIVKKNNNKLTLYVKPGTALKNRKMVLNEWYRDQIKQLVPALLEKWQLVIGEHVADWGVKKMKTKWGGCNIEQRRIWLNLELAKKPPQCLEYILVHEMAHLIERHHNDRFRELMDGFMPTWRLYRDELNKSPLAHEDWSY